MKSVRKILAMLLVVILMATAFAGCGRKDEPEDTPEVTTSATAEETTTPEPEESPTTTPENTEEPVNETPEPTSGPTGEVDADQVLGTIEGNTYTNEFFGFTMTLPEGWYMATREELAQILSVTEDYMNSDTEGITIDLEAQQIIPMMFTASRNPFADAGPNSNIVCLAQNIGEYASLIADIRSFINLSVQGVKAQGMDMTFGEVEVLNLDGQEFARVSGTQVVSGMEIHQTMYAFIKDDFAVVFTLSSFTDEEAQQLIDVMDSMSFN